MGNSSGKESRSSTASDSRPGSVRQSSSMGVDPAALLRAAGERHLVYSPRAGRIRHDVPFLGIGGISDGTGAEPRRETKQEREARRAEKERVARLKERERSLKEESVDGGYLVTLGTYTGPEDFSKPIVRQLMIERRLAPFWRGLNDHSESWTEHQLVAAARGLRIPAPDEIPSDEIYAAVTGGEAYPKPITIPSQPSATQRPNGSLNPSSSSNLSVSHGHSHSGTSTPTTPSPLFRGRSKTLASLASKNSSQPELTPQEIRLPYEPFINGQPVEANLYKDVQECPICFLYYPPYLNRTRCCDQPICSECFVQIKRPDPHPPEHLDPNSPPPPEPKQQEEEGLLISEEATCPFCVQTEFGITFQPPPFRRGLVYAHQLPASNRGVSSLSSSPATSAFGGNTASWTRRRGQSISSKDPSVITTDRVRPDWAKKLADARAHAARRAAAATALHTAAYMMGGNGADQRSPFARRRRYLVPVDSGGGAGDGPERESVNIGSNVEMILAALEGQGASRSRRATSNDVPSGRTSSTANRTEELEELMMMEAIRLSLAAEEERKKKEEKDAAKEAKKEEKKKGKEQKKADKALRKDFLYPDSADASSFMSVPSPAGTPAPPEQGKGKGKAVQGTLPPGVGTLGFNPLEEPTSTINTEIATGATAEPGTSRTGQNTGLVGRNSVSSSGSSVPESSPSSPKPPMPEQDDLHSPATIDESLKSPISTGLVESPTAIYNESPVQNTGSYAPPDNNNLKYNSNTQLGSAGSMSLVLGDSDAVFTSNRAEPAGARDNRPAGQ